MKIFLSLTHPHSQCVTEYIFLIKKKTQKNKKIKAEETKEEKRISVENLTEYDDIVCEFALCTFNLPDLAVNFFWLFI